MSMNLFLMWQDRALSVYIKNVVTPILREPASALTGFWMLPGQIAFFGSQWKAELRKYRSLVAEVWSRNRSPKTDILRWAMRTNRW